mmetsp:Transcript_33377/g.93656  ORF Transcript_33377/g.93656 Transcript_33377/m.93656 type:complete len:318 (+) Transcript_33377:565-1518(+)
MQQHHPIAAEGIVHEAMRVRVVLRTEWGATAAGHAPHYPAVPHAEKGLVGHGAPAHVGLEGGGKRPVGVVYEEVVHTQADVVLEPVTEEVGVHTRQRPVAVERLGAHRQLPPGRRPGGAHLQEDARLRGRPRHPRVFVLQARALACRWAAAPGRARGLAVGERGPPDPEGQPDPHDDAVAGPPLQEPRRDPAAHQGGVVPVGQLRGPALAAAPGVGHPAPGGPEELRGVRRGAVVVVAEVLGVVLMPEVGDLPAAAGESIEVLLDGLRPSRAVMLERESGAEIEVPFSRSEAEGGRHQVGVHAAQQGEPAVVPRRPA